MDGVAMKKIIIIVLLLMMIPSVASETYIVVNETGFVQWKGNTDTRPTIPAGYDIIPYQDINSVLKDAKYDGIKFVNPEPPVEFEEIELTVRKSPLDPTQTIISGLTGAGAAYLMVRRKKV